MNYQVFWAIIILWMISSHAGTFFTWWVRQDAKKEMKAVIDEHINSVALVDTRGDLRQETWRLVGQLMLDLVGWNALLSGRPADPDTDWVSAVLLVVFNFVLTFNSYIAYHTRKESMAILRSQKETENGT